MYSNLIPLDTRYTPSNQSVLYFSCLYKLLNLFSILLYLRSAANKLIKKTRKRDYSKRQLN